MNFTDSFGLIIERLKRALNLPNDKALAEALGIKPNAFSNRRKLGSVPYAEIAKIALEKGLRLDWVVFGEGSPYRDGQGQDIVSPSTINWDLLALVFYELERAFGDPNDKAALQQAVFKSAIALKIYHEALSISGDSLQRAAVRTEAESYAAVDKTMKRVADANIPTDKAKK